LFYVEKGHTGQQGERRRRHVGQKKKDKLNDTKFTNPKIAAKGVPLEDW